MYHEMAIQSLLEILIMKTNANSCNTIRTNVSHSFERSPRTAMLPISRRKSKRKNDAKEEAPMSVDSIYV